MQKISYAELDLFIQEVDNAYLKSSDAAYNLFKNTEIEYPQFKSKNPLSDQFRSNIFDLYKQISGKSNYEVTTEESYLDVDKAVYNPYPYQTKSVERLALYHHLLAKLMSMIKLPAGSSILDMGCGWGTTSLELSQIGFKVTSLDINKYFCELVAKRAKLLNIKNIDIVNDNFFWIEKTNKKFDAIIFFECFHHCWEFERLLKNMHKILKPKGKIYFAAEPITNIFPLPWTLRMDGESLFVIRKHGWMELGFRSDFFSELLNETGWFGECIEEGFWEATSLYEDRMFDASKFLPTSKNSNLLNGKLIISIPDHNDIILYGPYINLPKGKYQIKLELNIPNKLMNLLYIDIVSENCSSTILKKRLVKSEEIRQSHVYQELTLNKSHRNVEIRLYYINQLYNNKNFIKSFLQKGRIIYENEKSNISFSGLNIAFINQQNN